MRLFMGYIRSARLQPWREVALEGVCLAYFDIRKRGKRAVERAKLDLRSHHLSGYSGPLMVDSGAFSAFKSSQEIQLEELLEFYLAVQRQERDLGNKPMLANLDVIPREPGTADPHAVRESERNYRFLQEQGVGVFPVLHVGEPPDLYVRDSPAVLGVGGAVPVIRKNTGKRAFLRYLLKVRQLYPQGETSLHVFGVAGPTMVPALSKIPIDSGDWIGWRICASMGNIQLPTRQTHITTAQANKYSKGIRDEELWAFVEPSPFTLGDLKETFEARALFNLWCWAGCSRGKWQHVGVQWVRLLEEVQTDTESEEQCGLDQFLEVSL